MNDILPENIKILVPVDGSENSNKAINYAIDIAKKYAGSINLIHVVRSAATLTVAPAEVFLDITKQLIESGKTILKESQEKLKEAGIEGTTEILQGHPGSQIVQFAEKMEADMIIMGSRGLGTVARFVLGSTSDYVSDNAKCPVLIVK